MKQGKLFFNSAKKIWESTLLEDHVVKEIVDRLWFQARIKVFRIRERIPWRKKGGQLSTPGIPDLIGWVPHQFNRRVKVSATMDYVHPYGIPLFIEVKRPGGVRRMAQIRFIDEAKAGGCIAFFAESWNDVIAEMANHGLVLKT